MSYEVSKPKRCTDWSGCINMWLNQYVGHAGLLFKLEPKYQSLGWKGLIKIV